MTKLDWTKAGQFSSDPGRVVDVGDYGILPDRLAGRKGNQVKRKKPKIKARNAGRPKSAEKENQSKPRPPQIKPKKKIKQFPSMGSLTIPEIISRATAKVGKIKSEIQLTERRLLKLREQLKSAERGLELAKNTPRRSAIGRALHEVQKKAEK